MGEGNGQMKRAEGNAAYSVPAEGAEEEEAAGGAAAAAGAGGAEGAGGGLILKEPRGAQTAPHFNKQWWPYSWKCL